MSQKIAQMALAALVLAAAGRAQPPAAVPAFDVASIKPAAPFNPAQIREGKIHIGVNLDGARLDIGGLPLLQLLCYAYSLKPFQVSGPDWIKMERFDVLAKLPEGASKDQVPEMLQALLIERFQLKLHREDREHPIYALVVGKNGPKLKEAPPDNDAPAGDNPPPPGPGALLPPPPGLPGFGQMRINRDSKGMTVSGSPMGAIRVSPSQEGGMHLEASKVTMARFADMLSQFVDRPVLDMTELKGNYQIALDLSMADMMGAARTAGFAMASGGMPPPPGLDGGRGPVPTQAAASPDSTPSAIFANVQQLGLKLEPRKTPVTTLIIEHAEKTPIEN